MTYKIDRKVPRPEPRGEFTAKVRDSIAKLRAGTDDSFLLTKEELGFAKDEEFKTGDHGRRIAHIAYGMGAKVSTRRDPDGAGIRVWREE